MFQLPDPEDDVQKNVQMLHGNMPADPLKPNLASIQDVHVFIMDAQTAWIACRFISLMRGHYLGLESPARKRSSLPIIFHVFVVHFNYPSPDLVMFPA